MSSAENPSPGEGFMAANRAESWCPRQSCASPPLSRRAPPVFPSLPVASPGSRKRALRLPVSAKVLCLRDSHPSVHHGSATLVTELCPWVRKARWSLRSDVLLVILAWAARPHSGGQEEGFPASVACWVRAFCSTLRNASHGQSYVRSQKALCSPVYGEQSGRGCGDPSLCFLIPY